MNASLSLLKKPLLMTTIGLFGASALLGIFFIISAPQGDSWKILATTTLLAFFSLFSMNNILRLDAQSYVRLLACIGIASNIVWTTLWLIIIWSPSLFENSHEVMWKTIWITSALSICVTLTANYLSMKNTSPILIAFKTSAIASAWFLYLYISPAILGVDGQYLTDSWQLVAILSIVFAFSTISTPILYKIQSGKIKNSDETSVQASHDDTDLRAEIEAELRPKIEAELRTQIEAELRQQLSSEQPPKK